MVEKDYSIGHLWRNWLHYPLFIAGTLQHSYATADNYTVVMNASNLISMSNASVEVIVQDVIASKLL